MDESGKRSGLSSNTNYTRPLPPPPPPPLSYMPTCTPTGVPTSQNAATGYSPAMGYPPTMGYPPSYNPPGYPPPYHQPQRPPPRDMHYEPSCRGRKQDYSGGIFLVMIISTLFICLIGIVAWLVMGPMFPILHVESFYVRNFNVSSDNKFTCSWESNITIENNQWGSKFRFERMQTFIYFRRDDLLASSYLEVSGKPITIGSNEKGAFNTNVSTDDYRQAAPPLEKKVVEEIRNKRKGGSIIFNMKINAWSKVETGLFFTSSRVAQVTMLCSGLKVNFEGNSGNGKWSGNHKDCEVDIL